MRKVLWAVAGLVVVVLAALGGVLAFDAPVQPPPLASVSKPFADVDFSDLPAVRTYPARDGTELGYRVYEGGGAQVVALIHGSSDDGSGMHPLAKALRDAGASVYVPVLRGHGHSGRNGDIDYIGQLEDDLADFVAVLRPLHPSASFSLIGFSSGGGFVLRVIATRDEKLFDRFIMISPALPPGAPTLPPDTGGWVSLAKPRIIELAMLNRLGVHWFNGLPILAFATSPQAPNLTSVYSFRLAVDFGATRDYLAALGRSTKPAALLVGGSDELFYADRFAPLFSPVRSDLQITMVPGIGHIGMIVTPAGIAAVRKSFLDLTATTKG
ncbi:MAG TPA: alpha/beta fold hydrolase [Xanthobacteraceae bacterium]|nr:alpha/beta fold hydrolase [Xanthobacteraceae bacterium]